MASEEIAAENGGRLALIVEPRYAKVMPWVLIVCGIGLAIASFSVRNDVRHASIEVVQSRTTSAAPVPRGSSATHAAAGRLPVTRRTTVDKPLSDDAFAGLLGISALLVVLGGFYSRITKISIAGNSVELAGAAAAADAEAIGKQIAQRLVEQLQTATQEGGVIPADEAARIVRSGAVAATRAQQSAVQLRLAAAASVRPVRVLGVDAAKVEALGTGMPLPDDLLEQLADQALEDVKPPDG